MDVGSVSDIPEMEIGSVSEGDDDEIEIETLSDSDDDSDDSEDLPSLPSQEERNSLHMCRHTNNEKFCFSDGALRNFSSKSALIVHERRHKEQCDLPCCYCAEKKEAPKIQEAKYTKLTKIMTAISSLPGIDFDNKEDLVEFLLSCLTTDTLLFLLKKVIVGNGELHQKMTSFFNLPVRVQQMSAQDKYKNQEEKRELLTKMNIRLHLGEEKQDEMNRYINTGLTGCQLRVRKEKKISAIPMKLSPGKNGYVVPLRACVAAMIPKSKWPQYDAENPDGIVLTVSTDGGSMDKRNGAVISKIQRRDDDWARGNRYKMPSLSATHAMLYIKETYENLKVELAPLYTAIGKGTLKCSDGKTRKLLVGESNDMKMTLLLTGRGQLFRRTSELLCTRCPARRRYWTSTPERHHFDGSLSPEDWKVFESFEKEDDPESENISKSNTRSYGWTTLEELREIAKRIEELQEDVRNSVEGAAQELDELRKTSGVEHMPITAVPIYLHFTELLHATEGVTKRVVKLMVLDVPNKTIHETRVKYVFKKYIGVEFKETKNEQLWQRLDKDRLNRVQWLKMLQGFFDESGFF